MLQTFTPMKKSKHFLDELKSILGDDFKFKMFNESKSKDKYVDYYDYSTAGASEDCYYIYLNKEEKFSFGFIFNYIDLDEEFWNIKATFKPINQVLNSSRYFVNPIEEQAERAKLNKKIISSEQFSLVDFKTKLKEFNKSIKDDTSQDNILKNLKSIFDVNAKKIDLQSEVETGFNEVESFLSNKISEHEKVAKLAEKATSVHDYANREINDILSEDKDFIKLEKLKKQIKLLENKVHSKRTKLEEDYELNLKRMEMNKENEKVKKSEQNLHSFVKRELRKQPSYRREGIKKRFKMD